MWRVDFFFKINKRASTFIREMRVPKAKLQKEGIFFLIHLFARESRDILLMKKLEIVETKTTT